MSYPAFVFITIFSDQSLEVQPNPGQAALQSQNPEVLLLDQNRAAGQNPAAQPQNPAAQPQNPGLEVRQLPGQSLELPPDLNLDLGKALSLYLNDSLLLNEKLSNNYNFKLILKLLVDQNLRAHPEVGPGQSPAVNPEVLPGMLIRFH